MSLSNSEVHWSNWRSANYNSWSSVGAGSPLPQTPQKPITPSPPMVTIQLSRDRGERFYSAIGDEFESGGRHCLFDVVVFAGRASLGILQEVVHPWQFDDRGV